MEKIRLSLKCVEVKTVTTETEEGEREQIRTSFTELMEKGDERAPQKISMTGNKLPVSIGEEVVFELFSPQTKLE
jgi:hypothetical protein